MLSISDFSEMCCLSPQRLRYYHAAGLLVPAEVDERTGYRWYTFAQVEQAMLITALRDAGMGVDRVRRALDEPDTALTLLRELDEEIRRRRRAQDEALGDARELLTSWPEVRRRHVPEMTVVSKLVPGPAGGHDPYAWDLADAAFAATVKEVTGAVTGCGGAVSGVPWRTPAIETPEQQRRSLTEEGPHWLAKIPVTADENAFAALPGDVEVQVFAARDELSILIPGRSSMAKYATALSRLASHPLDAAFVDVAHVRQLLHDDDGVETAAAIRPLHAAG